MAKPTYEELEHQLYMAIDTIMDYQHRLLSMEKVLNNTMHQYELSKKFYIDDKERSHKQWEAIIRNK